jgi:hypothetical protein
MPSISIPAAIIGAGAIGGAASLASTSVASNAASQAAQANNGLESSIYNQNSANEQPYIQSGDAANTALQGFLGIGGNPQASQAALNNYLNSTGYQFNLNQGLDATQTSAAAKGLLGSGATLESLDTYATGLADSYGQQYEGDLQSVVNTGAGAANALAGEGENYANAVSTNNNSAASTTANAALTGGSTVNSLIGNALTAYAYGQGGSSFGGGGGSSIAMPNNNVIGG